VNLGAKVGCQVGLVERLCEQVQDAENIVGLLCRTQERACTKPPSRREARSVHRSSLGSALEIA
jgi:hypothetical protein